jgi:hypothetical protein
MRIARALRAIVLAGLVAGLGGGLVGGRPATAQQALKLIPLTECGAFDTRATTGPTGGQPVQSGTTYNFSLQGVSCVPLSDRTALGGRGAPPVPPRRRTRAALPSASWRGRAGRR